MYDENTRLKQDIAGLRETLREWVERSLNGRNGDLTKDDLTKLVLIAHPDKWQGQPAEALAHEITVRLNALRERRGGKA